MLASNALIWILIVIEKLPFSFSACQHHLSTEGVPVTLISKSAVRDLSVIVPDCARLMEPNKSLRWQWLTAKLKGRRSKVLEGLGAHFVAPILEKRRRGGPEANEHIFPITCFIYLLLCSSLLPSKEFRTAYTILPHSYFIPITTMWEMEMGPRSTWQISWLRGNFNPTLPILHPTIASYWLCQKWHGTRRCSVSEVLSQGTLLGNFSIYWESKFSFQAGDTIRYDGTLVVLRFNSSGSLFRCSALSFRMEKKQAIHVIKSI